MSVRCVTPVALSLSLFLFACHSSSDSATPPAAEAGAATTAAQVQAQPQAQGRPISTDHCSMTLSGPVTGTFDCNLNASAAVKPNMISISAGKPGVLSAMIKIPEGFKAGTWAAHDGAIDASLGLMHPGTGQWLAGKGAKGSDVALTLASASPDPRVSVVYRVSGTIDATMVSGTNAPGGPLKMHIAF